MFWAMTRMRPDWARKPEVAMAIDFKKSTGWLLRS
jgi:hypothetical protein